MTVVVEYGGGIPGSIVNMFEKVGAKAVISSDPAQFRKRAEKKFVYWSFPVWPAS